MAGMRLLVLGGTHHVGRAVAETALSRGDAVTTLTRGVSGPSASGALSLHADRTDPAALRAVLGDATWDAVIDTWSGARRVVLDSAGLLGGGRGGSSRTGERRAAGGTGPGRPAGRPGRPLRIRVKPVGL